MSRSRQYTIECDDLMCMRDVWGLYRNEAEQVAREEGWLLGSKEHGDRCPKCRDDLNQKDSP